MEPSALLHILHTAERLKEVTRHCYTSGGRHESVAEHSWRLCLMAYFLKDEFPAVDIHKVILMCTLHDLGEAFTGDIPCFEKTAAHEEEESRRLGQWLHSLPTPYAEELSALFAEMNALRTPEAKLYKAIDKLEAVIQHNESDIATWLPNEYTLNLSYGYDAVDYSDYLLRLREIIREETQQKIDEAKQ